MTGMSYSEINLFLPKSLLVMAFHHCDTQSAASSSLGVLGRLGREQREQ